jgi:WD40 repeat protein
MLMISGMKPINGVILLGLSFLAVVASTTAARAGGAPKRLGFVAVKLWDVPGQKPLATLLDVENSSKEVGWFGAIRSVAFSPDGKRLVVPAGVGLAKVWDLGTQEEVAELTVVPGLATSQLQSAVFLPDGSGLLVSDRDSIWRVDLANHTARTLFPHKGRLVAFSPDGSRCAADQFGYPSTDAGIQVYDTAKGTLITNLRAPQNRFLAFNPDGQQLATVRYDTSGPSYILVWDLRSGGTSLFLTGSDPLCFSPDGKKLAATGQDRAEILIAEAGMQGQTSFRHGHHTLQALAYSPDGRVLATAGADGPPLARGGVVVKPPTYTIKLWDLATQAEIASFEENTVRIDVLAFSPDGKILASAGSEERLDPSDHEWIAQHTIDAEPEDSEGHAAMRRIVRFYTLTLGGTVGLLLAVVLGWLLWRVLAKRGQRTELTPD